MADTISKVAEIKRSTQNRVKAIRKHITDKKEYCSIYLTLIQLLKKTEKRKEK